MSQPFVNVPANTPEILSYNQQHDAIWLALIASLILISCAFMWFGWSAYARDRLSVALGRRQRLITPIYVFGFVVALCLLVLPIGYFLDIGLGSAWERPVPSFGDWLTGSLITAFGAGLLSALLVPLVYGAMKRAPSLWWAIVAVTAWVVAALGLQIDQMFVKPASANMRPLPDGPMRKAFEALAERCGVDRVPIFLTDDSGIGGTVHGVWPFSRIVLGEQTLNSPPGEQVTTFAHELKHYLFQDNWLALLTVAVILIALAALIHIIAKVFIWRFGKFLKLGSIYDLAAFPLLVSTALAGWTFLATPTLNLVQQHVEREATRFSFEITRDSNSDPQRLAREGDPLGLKEYYPFYRVFRASHPSAADNARLANSWRPWEEGEPGRYEDVCEPPVASAF
ncbi:M48 family metalloprotease [Novosphingopyxis sp.]|uniref:M48 family metalloprotease n=1 Tax=Novosphingopyxis sp. TaxID=2709690 RepID=UPI003B5B6185